MKIGRYKYISVVLEVEPFIVGSSEVYSNIDFVYFLASRRNTYSHLFDRLKKYIDDSRTRLRLGKDSPNSFERYVYMDPMHKLDLVPGMVGSGIKGFLRSVFTKVVLERVLYHRYGVLLDPESLSEVVSGVEVKYLEDIGSLLSKFNNIYKKLGEDKARVMLGMYLIYSSPFACMFFQDGLGCSLPVSGTRLSAMEGVNRLIERRYSGMLPYVSVGGARHYVPLNYMCVGCSLFGAPGFRSFLKFDKFRLVNEHDLNFFVFNKISLKEKEEENKKKSNVKAFNFEVAGLDAKRARLCGVVRVVDDEPAFRALTALSYMGFLPSGDPFDADVYRGVLGDDIYKSIVMLLDRKLSVGEFYERILRSLLEYAVARGDLVRLGRRRSSGFGRVIGYSLEVIDQ